ncbi:MAG: outer membrane beta-barrel domain-containing protein [Kofleriaceae bacterium]
MKVASACLLVGASLAAVARPAAADDADDAGDATEVAAAAVPPPPVAERTTGMCIDAEIADRLALKRKRRGAVDRLFVKQGRHELSLGGGYYGSDLFSGTYVAGGSYTFHMTETTAVEFGAQFTHANADLIRAVEASRGQILDDTYAGVWMASSLLVWSPFYGKFRLGGSIVHFDLHLDGGVGVVDAQTSRGAMGVAGLGMKLFASEALALRIDARNHTFYQELLDERFLVNDASITAGLSVLLPFHN